MRLIDQGGWGRDTLTVIGPTPAIADVAEFFWIEEWSGRRPTRGRYRVVADDAPHIIWHVHGGRRRAETLSIVGARSVYRDVDVSRRMLTVGVRMRPGVVGLVSDHRASELTDHTLPFLHALPRRVASPERIVDALSLLLEARQERHRITRIVAHVNALDPAARHGFADIARGLNMSERTLRNQSRDALGIGLKRFLRIRRLHLALRLQQRTPKESWSRIASESGYADQAPDPRLQSASW